MATAYQKIVPHLWFDKEAKQAAEFYISIFPDSGITHATTLKNTPSGDCDLVSFVIRGYSFKAISAGPYFKLNPSVSFFVNYDPSRDEDAADQLDEAWSKLSEGGQVLMPLGEYPFSKKYGWVQDKYGVSWQLILTNPDGEERPAIIPSLLFVGDQCGRAEEAMNLYLSTFGDSRQGQLMRYPRGMEPEKEGFVMFADFMLEQQCFVAMDSAQEHKFAFNEAISFLVYCDSQEEINAIWGKLSAIPEAEQCGWLKDKFNISWQVVPRVMDEMMSTGTPEQRARVTKAFMSMKKFDLAELRKAYEGS